MSGMRYLIQQLVGVLVSVPAIAGSVQADDRTVDFASQIAPILESHCVRCHSPGNPKGDLSLATAADLRENEYIVPGEPDSSYLLDLLIADGDQPPAMPKEGAPLADDELALIRRWIARGAQWPEDVIVRERSKADSSWWSLQPLQAPTVRTQNGTVDGSASPANVIDGLVLRRLREVGLEPNPAADRRTLIRRATYDLWGLPPTPEAVEEFVQDPDPLAYEKLIDRLLASPHYGERWGRHWLDVVRFGESNGYERNVIINDLWPFRDYVIRSFNEDKPFDQFIREHLAGDVLHPNRPEVVTGSAFLVAGPYDDVGNQDPVQAAQIRANTIDEIIRTTAEAFLGLTVGCARCHDHKFDPIAQEDYYALYATFAGVRHGSRVVATPEQKAAHAARSEPLEKRQRELREQRDVLQDTILKRAMQRLDEYRQRWTRPRTDRQGTEETFGPVTARFVRLVSEGQDANPLNVNSFAIDEFEVWSAEEISRNVALAAEGAEASGPSREIEDFPGAYGPQLAIDGKTGERFLATGGHLTIRLAAPTPINRVVFSSARGESIPEHGKFVFLADYRIEVSEDGEQWTEVADSRDRQPVSEAHRNHRLRALEMTAAEARELRQIARELAAVKRQLDAIPPLPTVWVGRRAAEDAQGPFHVFLGGNPQRPGDEVVAKSLSALSDATPTYRLDPQTPEAERRVALADWIVHPENPLTPRVLANRLWHYHFGTGIVDTPSDFGYMGSRPTHPELLDWLALQVHEHDWRLKPLHKLIMLSQTYQRSSTYRAEAARVDGDARLLWRFPPRRLSAEEIRDTILRVAGKLESTMGGPGFRLYRFMQDNVCTYVPLDEHGPETWRRAVYHQNARASVVDLMTDFDQPDCAFATPKRDATISPLQALTLLNHDFTVDMAAFLAERLEEEAGDRPEDQIERLYQLCLTRSPDGEELAACRALVAQHGLRALCRVMLNTSELIWIR